jgi:tetratricopeptide (TPR) repeat protein
MYPNFTSPIARFVSLVLLTIAAGCTTTGGTQLEQTASVEMEIPAAVQDQYEQALMQLEAGDDDSAAVQLEAFVELYPGYATPYINLAAIYSRQGRNDEALAALSRALDIDGSDPIALNRLGILKRSSGDFAAAENAWRSAIAAHPEYPNSWYNLAVLYDLYLQNLPAALEHYQAYQRLNLDSGSDADVARWIADLESRIGGPPQTAQAR